MKIATLQRLAAASSLSYLPLQSIPSSPYHEKSLQPIHQVVDPITESGATIFVTHNNNNDSDDSSIIVACRGSATIKNFATNLKFNLVPVSKLPLRDVPEGPLIHEGFQDASFGLWRELGPKLFDVIDSLEDADQKKEVFFTGHSLGGATALLCSIHYNASPQKSKRPSIVSFGGPKLCNSALARHIRNTALQDCNILHLVHDKDPVLANNQQLWDSMGFENVGVEMDCEPNSAVIYEEKQSGGAFAWNLIDHCYYLGMFVGPRLF